MQKLQKKIIKQMRVAKDSRLEEKRIKIDVEMWEKI
jgi:hypothetical protein